MVPSEVRVVYVSPMRRTLQTAWTLFENCDVKFVIHPLIHERLHFSCDVPSDIHTTLSDHSHMNLDTSFMPKDQNGNLHPEWCGINSDLMLKEMKEKYGDVFEEVESVEKRAATFIKDVEGQSDIAVVSHKNFLKVLI